MTHDSDSNAWSFSETYDTILAALNNGLAVIGNYNGFMGLFTQWDDDGSVVLSVEILVWVFTNKSGTVSATVTEHYLMQYSGYDVYDDSDLILNINAGEE